LTFEFFYYILFSLSGPSILRVMYVTYVSARYTPVASNNNNKTSFMLDRSQVVNKNRFICQPIKKGISKSVGNCVRNAVTYSIFELPMFANVVHNTKYCKLFVPFGGSMKGLGHNWNRVILIKRTGTAVRRRRCSVVKWILLITLKYI